MQPAFYTCGIHSRYILLQPLCKLVKKIVQIRFSKLIICIIRNDISAEIELIKSKEFLRTVLTDLPLETSYYTEGKFLNTENYQSSPYLVKYSIKDSTIIGLPIYVDFISEDEAIMSIRGINYNLTIGENVQTAPIDINISLRNYEAIQAAKSQVSENRHFFIINDINTLVNSYSKKHYSAINERCS